MQTLTDRIDRPAEVTAIDPWSLLTGGSAAIVAGFAADLLRLGLHRARQSLVSRGAARPSPVASPHWRCSRSCG